MLTAWGCFDWLCFDLLCPALLSDNMYKWITWIHLRMILKWIHVIHLFILYRFLHLFTCTGAITRLYQWKWTWWRHQMETFSRYWPFVRGIHRSPVNSPHKGQWRGALMFSLICVWINDWVNDRDAGDLRRYRAHYDAIVMKAPGEYE